MSRALPSPIRVLLTGFGPFPGVPDNPATRLVEHIGARKEPIATGIELRTAVFPTVWDEAGPLVLDLLKGFDPDIALHFGVHQNSAGIIRIEQTARNLAGAQTDAEGRLCKSPHIVAEAPASLHATIPAQHIAARLRATGYDAEVSDDAGDYLCNMLLYVSLHAASISAPKRRTGFIHIPEPAPSEITPGFPYTTGRRHAEVTMPSLVNATGVIIDCCVAAHS